MKAEVAGFDNFSIPRIAQLTQRSNQFNLRTTRYTEEDLDIVKDSDEYKGFSISLNDKYGDYGLIAVIILKKISGEQVYFIDTWLMSCRVLKRGIENLTLNKIVVTAGEAGIKKIRGEYIPTSKNGMVKEHYDKLGFMPIGENQWELNIDTFKERKHYISHN
jgi:FkbH-like protein